MNSLVYEDALEIDKRTYLQYYLSLLKTKHLLIFNFYTYDDYNSKIIKITTFFFYIGLFFTVNALFFDDSTLHKIYTDEGVFNFIFQLPILIYSSLINNIVSSIIKYFSLSENNIITIKRRRITRKKNKRKIIKCLIIKYIIFYTLSFIFLIFFWYYLSSFCAIYPNTQIYLIKDSTISFGLTLFYPLLLNFIPGIFRIGSLRSNKKDKKCLYQISKYIQLI